MLIAALVFVAAVAHATWNVTIKRAGATGVSFLWLSFVVGAVLFAPFGVASLASEATEISHWMPLALVSGALQVGYFLLLQHSYSKADVSAIYPLARGTGPLLSVLLAIALLGERPTPVVLLGTAVVIAGVLTIGLAGGRAAIAHNRPGVVYGVIVGAVIAIYTVWDAAAVTVGQLPPIGFYWGSVVVQVILLAIPAIRRWPETRLAAREHSIAILIVGVLAPLAYMLVLTAMQLAPVSVVAPAREISVVFVGLAGWLFLRESHAAQRLVGATIVLVGVALLAVG